MKKNTKHKILVIAFFTTILINSSVLSAQPVRWYVRAFYAAVVADAAIMTKMYQLHLPEGTTDVKILVSENDTEYINDAPHANQTNRVYEIEVYNRHIGQPISVAPVHSSNSTSLRPDINSNSSVTLTNEQSMNDDYGGDMRQEHIDEVHDEMGGESHYDSNEYFYGSNHETNTVGKYTAGTKISVYTVISDIWCPEPWSYSGTGARYANILGPETSIHSTDLENSIISETVYPNPFTSEFNIRFASHGMSDVQLQLYDLGGKVIDSKSYIIESSSDNYEIKYDGSDLKPGLYLYQIRLGNRIKSGRIAKN